MKLSVAGKDRSEDIVPLLKGAADELAALKNAPRFLPPHQTALLLRTAADTSDYLEKLTKLVWIRTGVSTMPFWIPSRPGFLGKIARFVRLRLWLLFRYQHDRIAFQQNTINCQLASTIEFMLEDHRKEIDGLNKRIEELEKRGGES